MVIRPADAQAPRPSPAADRTPIAPRLRGGPAVHAAGGDPTRLARELLRVLGRGDHPDAETNPVFALYQVALDSQCASDGYRALCEVYRQQLEDGTR